MSDMLSQEEINALLGGDKIGEDETGAGPLGLDDIPDIITSEDKDILGEVGNISMGTSATTLFALLGQKVSITTPTVSVVRWADVSKNFDRPCVGVRVNYTVGIKGTNVLLLKHNDVKIITSLMMGWGGVVEGEDEINEMDLSAMSEAMNQMVGSSSTSLASLTKTPIDIDTPFAFVVDFATHEMLEDLGFEDEYAVCVQFRMEIGDLIDSNIMQLLPLEFARHLVDVMKSYITGGEPPQAAIAGPAEPVSGGGVAMNTQMPTSQAAPPPQAEYAPQQQQQAYVPPPQTYAQPAYVQQPQYSQPHVDARAAQFQNFDVQGVMQQKENIEIIMDVPLEVTVELGRTTKKIKEILEFSPGSIIELNKLAGEPIDILVNGKFVAKGEVVVIDENFGIRVTNIINAEYRI